MGIERRRAPRYRLVADAEILSPVSSISLKARTSDVSLFGCFMNTSYALPQGTEIQLQLKYAGTILETEGEVARSEPSMGFGVSFALKGSQQTILSNWLESAAAR